MPCTVLSGYLLLNYVSLFCADGLGSGDLGSGDFQMGKLLTEGPEQRPHLLAEGLRVLRDGPMGTVLFLLMGKHLRGWEWAGLAVFLCHQPQTPHSHHEKLSSDWNRKLACLPLSVQSS